MVICKEWNQLLQEPCVWSSFMLTVNYTGSEVIAPRVCHTAVKINNKIYIYGGHVPTHGPTFFIGEIKKDLYSFDLDSQSWEVVATSQELPQRTEHSCVLFNDKLYFFGGYESPYTCSMFTFDPATNEMELIEMSGDIPLPRSAHSAVVYGNKMYVFGGWEGTSSRNDLVSFDFETKEWRNIEYKGVTPHPVRSHNAVVYKDSMYVLTGFGEDVHSKDIYAYNFASEEWSVVKVSGYSPTPRSRSRCIVHDNFLYLFGGWDRTVYFKDMWRFNFETGYWTEIPTDVKSGLGQHSAVIHKNRLFIFGGFQSNLQAPTNTMLCYKLP